MANRSSSIDNSDFWPIIARKRPPIPATMLVLLAAVVLATMWPLVTQYRLQGDDFALVLNSSPPYVKISDAGLWFTSGFSDYFRNYPDWPGGGTDYSRPLVNLVFHLSGYLAARVGQSAFLLANYVALFATALLTYVIFRGADSGSKLTAALMGVAVGLSPVWYSAMDSAAYLTNALALMLGVASIAVVVNAPRDVSPKRIALCALLQVLAVASHETALVLPFVTVGLLVGLNRPPVPFSRLLPLVSPLIYFIASRVLLDSTMQVSGIGARVAALSWTRLAGFLFAPVLPVDLQVIFHPGGRSELEFLAVGFTMSLGFALTATLLWGLSKLPLRRSMALLFAVVAARLPGLATAMEPRFMGLGMVVGLTLLLLLTRDSASRPQRTLAASLVLVSSCLLFAAGPVTMRQELVAANEHSGVFYDAAQDVVRAEPVETVLLLNDTVGQFGSLAMLRMIAWPREDLELVVLNSLSATSPTAESAEVQVLGDRLEVVNALGEGQRAVFPGASPDFSTPNRGFVYSSLNPTEGVPSGFRAAGRVTAGATLILGVDPSTGEPLGPRRF